MTLIVVKNKSVANMPYLVRLVLKRVYDFKRLTAKERNLMEHSFVWWSKKLKKDPDQMFLLQKLAKVIQKDDNGDYNIRKEMFKKKDIDYRKFHRLAEAFN